MSNKARAFILGATALFASTALAVVVITVTASSWMRSNSSNGTVQRKTIVVFFDEATPGVHTQSVTIGSNMSVLERVIFESDDCTDCDVIVRTGSTAGYGVVYARNDYDDLSAAPDRIEGQSFPQYGNDTPGTGFTSTTLTVALDNNDGGDRDGRVTLVLRAD